MGNWRISTAEGSKQVRRQDGRTNKLFLERLFPHWQRALALSIVIATMIVACASEDAELSTHRQFQSLSSEQSRVLGFEDAVNDWTTNNGTQVLSSSSKVEGAASLSLTPQGYTVVSSRSISSPGVRVPSISFAITVPASLTWGEARLVVEMPSQGIYWRDLGGNALTNLAAGSFHTLTFSLPDDVADALEAEASDLSFKIVINAPSAGAFLLDALSLGGLGDGSGQPSEDQAVEFQMSLVMGVTADQTILSGMEGVKIDSRATITASNEQALVAGFAPSIESPAIEIQAGGATVNASIRSTGAVQIGSQGVVNGDITSSGDVVLQDASVMVSGDVAVGGAVREVKTGWQVNWPLENRGSLTLPVDSSNREMISGAYGVVSVGSRATITFRSGTYFLTSLEVEPEAHMRIDASAGPVVIYVKDTLRLNVGLEYLSTGEGRVLLGYLGSSPALFQEAIEATVVAPNGAIELRRPASGLPHRGSFFGRSIQVFSDATVLHAPFNFDAVCLSGTFNGTACAGTAPSPTTYTATEVYLPQGISPTAVSIAARHGMTIGAGAQVEGEGKFVTVAQGGLALRAGAHVMGVAASGAIVAEEGAVIDGDALSDEPLQTSGATVNGSIDAAAGLAPPVTYSLRQTFPRAADGNVALASGRSKILAPGHYGSIRVDQNATIYIRSGNYTCTELVVAAGGTVVVMPDSGWAFLAVSSYVDLAGNVRGIGQEDAQLAIIHTGLTPARISGSFAGAVLSPRASLQLSAGPHAGYFYGDRVDIAPNTTVAAAPFPWRKVADPDVTPDVVIKPDPELPGALDATTLASGHVSKSSGFDFVVPSRLPVSEGNAGNASATLTMTHQDGSVSVCSYQGAAPVPSPTTLMDVALGREYVLEACSGPATPGQVVRLTDVQLDLAGDPSKDRTAVSLPLAEGCNGDLVMPISLAESRQLIESFQWPAGVAPFNASGLLPETVDGKHSLFYAQIYVTSKAQLELLDRLLIHWEKAQIFPEEWPSDWDNRCGIIHYDHDGEGAWVWAVLPGAMYNAIVLARNESSIPEGERDVLRAIRILDPPAALATSAGSFDVQLLGESGFEYRGLTGIPDAVALQEALFPAGVADAMADAAKWIWDRGKNALQGVAFVIGVFDRIYGTVDVRFKIGVPTRDLTFAPGSLIQTAWGTNSGEAIVPEGVKVNLWTMSIRPTSPLPFSRLNTDRLSASGATLMHVARSCPNNSLCGDVAFKRVCLELENEAGYVTTFLGASSVCNRRFDEGDFNHFQQDVSLEWHVDDRDTRHLTEVTDSYNYLAEVVGEYAKQARVTVGPNATLLSLFNNDNAAALCLGFGDPLADIVASFPVVGPYMAVLANTDILITDGSYAKDTRGLMTHEYGHYALCDLVRKNGESLTADVVLSLDTLAAGAGDPGPDDEARVVNEAFADFFSLQIASGTNYSWLRSAAGDPSTVRAVPDGGFTFSVDNPGGDINVFAEGDASNNFAVGRLAGLMHDLFDGRRFNESGPTSAAAWISLGTNQVEHRISHSACLNAADPHCRIGDVDLEQIKLGGELILTAIHNFQLRRNALQAYRTEAMEKGMIDTALDHSNWCQTCLLAAPHFSAVSSLPTNTADFDNPFARDLIEICQSDSTLADRLGEPPRPTVELDALTCERCPAGQGMGRDGRCAACSVDVTLDWSTVAQCTAHTVPFASPAGDSCPETFVVEVTHANSIYPVLGLHVAVAEDIADAPSCASTRLMGEVQRAVGAGSLQPYSSFDVAGVFPNCPEREEGEITPPGCNPPLCEYPTPTGGSGPNLNISGSAFRIVANAGALGAEVTLSNYTPSCDEIIR